MPAEHNRLFWLSGIFSFTLYGILIFVIGWQVRIALFPTSYAMVQSDTISVSLDVTETKVSEPSTPDVIQPMSSSEVDKTESENVPKPAQPEITDLFSTIKTTKTPSKVKENTLQVSDLSALEQKVLSSKRDSKLLDKAKNLDLGKSGVKMVSASTGPMVNEYYAKVQGIIYANFHPASGTEGFSARIRIQLSANGKLKSYRVISYSGNAVFNAEVDLLKERLGQVVLPSHPEGEDAVIEIILTAKD